MPLTYTVVRSNRKTLALEVNKTLQVLVRAPNALSASQIDHFVQMHATWIETQLSRMRDKKAAHPDPTPDQMEALRQRAKDYLPGRVAYFSDQMQLFPVAVSITSAKTRFGSCSAKNRICFSCLLMAYPNEAIDYVIVHELAHIVHKNHGAAFYTLIAQYLPDWKSRRQLLR